MDSRTRWFIAALILVALLSIYAPRFAGALVVLVAVVLAIELANKKLV